MYAIAANNGVQIVVETHSDHFLNGVRVATKNKVIRHIHIDKSILHFALMHQHWQKLICHCLFLPTIYRYFPVDWMKGKHTLSH
jgi:hypothetical protein